MPTVFTRSDVPDPAAERRRCRQRGFSLLELLIVLAIMGLLGALVGPRLLSSYGDSQVKAADVQVRMLKSALDTMRLDLGRYPSADEGLQLLVAQPTDQDTKNRWHGPYLDGGLPNDPWGRPYMYSPDGKDPNPVAIYSYGPDGKPGDKIVGYPPRD